MESWYTSTEASSAERWEDFVTLGLTEIREYGATSVQITRRLRALLEALLETVRPEHRPAIEEELRRLDATIAESWRDSVDLDRAAVAHPQGMATPLRTRKARSTESPQTPGESLAVLTSIVASIDRCAHLLLLAAEVNAVLHWHLWPRSMTGRLEPADQIALRRYAEAAQHDAREQIAVSFRDADRPPGTSD